jgi:phage/plasmid-like protein (TIGR03299 family)
VQHFLDNRTPGFLRLGKHVNGAKSADEVLAYTGLDYRVSMEPLIANAIDLSGDAQPLTMTDRYATVAWLPEGPKPIDVVSARYAVLQNTDAFRLCTDLVDDSGAKFVCAGALNGGKKVFIGMQLPGHMLVGGVDPLEQYLLAWNGHDGRSSLRLAITNVRIWCTNQLRPALRSAKRAFSVKHTTNMTKRLQAARDALALTFKYQADVEEQFERMLDKRWSDAQFEQLVKQLIPPAKPDADKDEILKLAGMRDDMLKLWDAPTQQNIKGTAYAAYQAAVEWADWYAPLKRKDITIARANAQITDRFDDLKQRAFELTAGVQQ